MNKRYVKNKCSIEFYEFGGSRRAANTNTICKILRKDEGSRNKLQSGETINPAEGGKKRGESKDRSREVPEIDDQSDHLRNSPRITNEREKSSTPSRTCTRLGQKRSFFSKRRREKKDTPSKRFHAMEYRSSRCRGKKLEQQARKKNIRRKASLRKKEGEETSAGKSGVVGIDVSVGVRGGEAGPPIDRRAAAPHLSTLAEINTLGHQDRYLKVALSSIHAFRPPSSPFFQVNLVQVSSMLTDGGNERLGYSGLYKFNRV